MNISKEQRRALENLWFIYGNGGPKHSHGNHKFIQGILERGEDDRQFYRRPGNVKGWDALTQECEQQVDALHLGTV